MLGAGGKAEGIGGTTGGAGAEGARGSLAILDLPSPGVSRFSAAVSGWLGWSTVHDNQNVSSAPVTNADTYLFIILCSLCASARFLCFLGPVLSVGSRQLNYFFLVLILQFQQKGIIYIWPLTVGGTGSTAGAATVIDLVPRRLGPVVLLAEVSAASSSIAQCCGCGVGGSESLEILSLSANSLAVTRLRNACPDMLWSGPSYRWC